MFYRTIKRIEIITLLFTSSAISNLLDAQTPTIISFSPSCGAPGTLVTITGTNLRSLTAFTIGGARAIEVSNSGTQLVGMVMPGSVTGTVSIATGSGTATSGNSFTVTATPFPSLQQGNKLVGTGALGKASQGNSVSISADGNTAIVGGDGDNYGSGAVWIYIRSGGFWTQQSKLVDAGAIIDNTFEGFSVSISADGNTAIVGGVGAAWVYIRSGRVWTQQGSKLVGTGAIGQAFFQGNSVSISADGNTAIVGICGDNYGTGAAWIYTRTGGAWTQQGNKLVGTGAIGQANQGSSVSISADGNTAIVGGNYDDTIAGAAWIYTRTGGVWTQQGNKLVGSGSIGTYAAEQGCSVSISADGNSVIVGGFQDNDDVGAVWIYTRTGGVWTQQGNKLVGSGANGTDDVYQGFSVSISADGNTAIEGAWDDKTGAGAIWFFTRTGGVWSQQGNKLVGTGTLGANQGFSVSISLDGTTAIVGGEADNGDAGATWIFIDTNACNVCNASSLMSLIATNTCPGKTNGLIILPAAGTGNSYHWSNGDTAQDQHNLAEGSYTVTVTDDRGCTGTTTTMVNTFPSPVADAGIDQIIAKGERIQLSSSGGVSCVWTPSISLDNENTCNPIANPEQTTIYTVIVTDVNSCSASDSVKISVVEIFVPSAFSPNGDGVNDFLYVRGTACMTQMRFFIYDRWGELVFETTDKDAGWNGTFKGKLIGTAVFSYYLTATLSNGMPYSTNGNITLLR